LFGVKPAQKIDQATACSRITR